MAERERLDDEGLKTLLGEEISAAVAYDGEELSSSRAKAIRYYNGDVSDDIDDEAGKSKAVSRDVADTMGWMLPGIIRVFTASDRMVEYKPVGKGDDQFAELASDYINHIFWKDNPGYRILWDATHDSLLQANGIVKHWWDDAEECEYSEHSGMTEIKLAMLVDGGGEIVSQRDGEPQRVMAPGPDGQPIEQEIPTWDVKLKRVTRSGGIRIECIEPENFLKNRECITLDKYRFVAHRNEKTRSDLIEMGFSRDLVDGLPAHSARTDSEETTARKLSAYGSMVGHRSTELIELYECYIQADVDGDGISETVRAYYAGKGGAGELLDWEVWDDDIPFSDIPCEPVPHRFEARSITDETMDVQLIKTALTRQMLNNMYWVNNPQTYAQAGGVDNPDALVNPQFGGVVWLNNKTTIPPGPLAIPFIGDKALMGLEHFDQVIEKRTGVSRSTMALDPETLQNQSATANQNQKDASYSQIELIARNQAELGWRRVFKQLLRLIVKHQDTPRTVRLRDKPVDIDPQFWNTNMDVTINVGLGTGSRDRDMAMLNNILQTQAQMTVQMFQAGMKDKAVLMMPKIIKTAAKLAESSGIRNPDEYYLDLPEEEIQQLAEAAMQPQPDPQIELEKMKIELQTQLEQAKMQAAVEKERAQMDADLQVKMAEMQATSQAEMQKQQFEAQKVSAEIGFEREKLAVEARMKERELEIKMQIELLKIEAQRAAAAEQNQLAREQGD